MDAEFSNHDNEVNPTNQENQGNQYYQGNQDKQGSQDCRGINKQTTRDLHHAISKEEE